MAVGIVWPGTLMAAGFLHAREPYRFGRWIKVIGLSGLLTGFFVLLFVGLYSQK